MRRLALAVALAVAAAGAAAQTAFEGAEYEGTNVRVAGPDDPNCPATGTVTYRARIQALEMLLLVRRAGDPQEYRDSVPIEPSGKFGRTRPVAGGESVSQGQITRDTVAWTVEFRRGPLYCRQQAELRRLGTK